MTLQNRALVFDAQSMRTEEWNGHLRIQNSNLTKANICEYYGFEINNYKKYGLDPERKYRFLRSPEALEKAVSSFKERPILYVHKAADADKLDNSKVIGTTGSYPQFNEPYIQCSLTIWDGEYIDAIKNGSQQELSSSYAFTPVMEKGTYEGQEYDGIMTDIYVDHVALVEQGRAGHDVRVADQKPIHFKGKKMAELTKFGNRLLKDLSVAFNNGRANDSNGQELVKIIQSANGVRKGLLPDVIAVGLRVASIANDEDVDRIDETVKKAMDEACEAKDSDDPVDTLEAQDDDEKDKPSVSDNDPNNKPKASDTDGDGKKPTADDEDENEGNKAKGNDNNEPSKANDSALIAKYEARAQDAANKAIEAHKLQIKEVREAEKLVRPIVGKTTIVSDSASDYYHFAIESLTGSKPPNGTSVQALKFMVEQLGNKQQRANDAARAVQISQKDADRFGATRLRSI